MPNSSLPEWNLNDLYAGLEDSKIKEDKDLITIKTNQFVTIYTNNINDTISEESLLKAIQSYEEIQELLSKLLSFAYLMYSRDVTNKEISLFLQKNRDFAQEIGSSMVFFDLSINQISENTLNKLLKNSPKLQFYKPFLEQSRKFKPYQLSESEEKILIAKQTVARSSWVKLYDEILAKLEFTDPLSDNKKISISSILNLQLSEKSETRKKAAQSLKKGLSTQEDIITTIINNITKDHSVNNKLRGFAKPYSSMNLHNLIDDSVMEGLVEAVSASYKDISQKYYKLKAKLLNVEKINYWDRNAPLFNVETKFTFNEAKDIVLNAFSKFNKDFFNIAKLFFDNNWIDAKLSNNKMSGAFAHPATVTAHPYVLVNFHGGYIDVTTLAHELGHGVHQYLARDVGELQAGTPLVLAETASIFAEQLVFDYLKNNTTDKNMHRYLLSNKIEGIINSVHRQIAFHEFEKELHDLRAIQDLTPNQIKEVFFKTQSVCLGSAVSLSEEDGIFWNYVSHFFHVPFYVYAYAFGDCLVRSLYSLYKQGNNNFIDNYLIVLKNGGKLTPKAAIEKFGFDISKNNFWQNGLNIIKNLITELEDII